MTPDALKTLRKRLGLSQTEFATLVGLKARETIQRWESGKIAIPRTIEIMLAEKIELPK